MRFLKNFTFSSIIFTALANGVFAHDFKIGNLEIKHPVARMTPPKAPVSAGYLEVVNNGETDDRLLSVTVEFAGKTEIHEMKMDGEVMKMRPLSNGIEIAAGESVVLEPGGKHIMFMMLKEQLVKGENKKATLMFEKAGPVEVSFSVEHIGTKKMDHSKHKMPKAE